MRSECAGLDYERPLWAAGHRAIAGVDEAGRGAWAGPVVAAAVILPPDPAVLVSLLGHVDDSKRLTPAARERAFALIEQHAVAAGVGSTPAGEIDRIGIAPATRAAMLAALAALAVAPDFVLVDYLTLPDLACLQRGIPHGDARSLSIAAASIVAKVTRDRWMAAQDAAFPGYGFACHKGYGVAAHAEALARLGPCALHRRSFRPVAEFNAPLALDVAARYVTGADVAARYVTGADVAACYVTGADVAACCVLDAIPQRRP